MKNPPCQRVLGGSQNSSGKLDKLFSSFLRGASCPKSPRVLHAREAADSPQPELHSLCLIGKKMSRGKTQFAPRNLAVS
jgi:hypothetical protein